MSKDKTEKEKHEKFVLELRESQDSEMDYPSRSLDAIWQQFDVIRSLVAWVTGVYQRCPSWSISYEV